MDYLTRYYKNLCEDLQRKLNLLEYVLPGVNPYSGRRTPTTGLLDFPQTRTLTGDERPSYTPRPTLNLGLMGRQDWYTKTKDSYWRSPQGMQRSAKLTSGFRAPSRAIDEIGKQLAALSDTYAKPAPSAQPATPTTTQAPSWLSGLQSDVNKAIASKPPEPTRDYRDVAREAQKAVAQRSDNIPGMPKLSANIKFSRGTREGIPVSDDEAMQYNLSPEERRQAARSTSLTPQSDLYSFMKLSQQEREDIAPGLPTSVLRGMERQQYTTSRQAVAMGREGQKLGADKVNALNTISRTLEDRKGPLGGKAGADTYFERVRRNVSPEDVGRALEAKNLPELGAMQDAGTRVAKQEFSQTGRMTPSTYQATRTIETTRDEALERKVRDTQDLLASREEAAKKMYGDQWMRYM